MNKILLILPLIILVAGCVTEGSSTGLVGTLMAEKEPAPEPVEDPKFPIGLSLSVGDTASTYSLDVTVKSAEITKSYTAGGKAVTASAGKTFILIDAKISQKGSTPIDAGRNTFFATDENMEDSYSSSYAGADGLVGGTTLTEGQVISGKAAFEVPEGLKGMKVVYAFGTQITVTNMVAWNIR